MGVIDKFRAWRENDEKLCDECNEREISYIVSYARTMDGRTKHVCEKCVLPYVENGKVFLDPQTESSLKEKRPASNYEWEIHEVNHY